MKKFTFLIICWFFCTNLMAQQNPFCTTDSRFTDAPVFSEDEIGSAMAISYGHALDYQGQDQNLIFNIYYPEQRLDSFKLRPLIVLVHGGGYSGGSLNGLDEYCLGFARRGYVAATVEYRLGWNRGAEPCDGDPNSMLLAFYRSLQDVHAAIRYLVANADEYGIDTSWIFAGGMSAGAFTTSNLAFFQQAEIDHLNPSLHNTLGRIDSSGNSLNTTFHLKGLFHNWGSVFNLGIIDASDAIPLIGFAGDRDPISPIDSGYWQGCTNFPLMFGTRAIHDRLLDLGVCTELNVKPGGGHGVWKDTPEQVDFRIGRACCFFKSLFCNTCTTVDNNDSIPSDCSTMAAVVKPVKEEIADINIYPNPFSDKLNSSKLTDKDVNYVLMNSMGQVVWAGNELNSPNFAGLFPGIYFMKIIQSTGNSLTKLVKE